MKVITETKKIYELEELSKEIQQKIIQDNYDINVDYEWYSFDYEDFIIELEKIGVTCDSFYFDLDRSNYVYMGKPSVIDITLLLKSSGYDLRTKEARNIIDYEGISIETQYFGGSRAKNYIDNDKCNSLLQSKLNSFLTRLHNSYDYYTSDIAIVETITNNHCTFLSNGTPY